MHDVFNENGLCNDVFNVYVKFISNKCNYRLEQCIYNVNNIQCAFNSLATYIYLQLARCSRTSTSNAVLPSIAFEPNLLIYSCSLELIIYCI